MIVNTNRNKYKLKKSDFNKAKNGDILYEGNTIDNSTGVNFNRSSRCLRYVIKKGYGDDWTVYFEHIDRNMTYKEIEKYGNKAFIDSLKNIIDAPKEIWGCYRL